MMDVELVYMDAEGSLVVFRCHSLCHFSYQTEASYTYDPKLWIICSPIKFLASHLLLGVL